MSITLDSRWGSSAKHFHSFMGLIKRPTLSCTLVLGGQSWAPAELAFNPECSSVPSLWTFQTHACGKSSKCFSNQKDPPTSYRCESLSQPGFPFSVWHPSFGWLNDMYWKQQKILLHRKPARIFLCICHGLGNTWTGPNCLGLPTW